MWETAGNGAACRLDLMGSGAGAVGPTSSGAAALRTAAGAGPLEPWARRTAGATTCAPELTAGAPSKRLGLGGPAMSSSSRKSPAPVPHTQGPRHRPRAGPSAGLSV